MIFLLIITLFWNGVLSAFDNTAWIDAKPAQLQPCQIVSTEHFSQATGEYSERRLPIHSSRIINEIVKHLLFLLPVERNIYFSESQHQFTTFINFIQTFDYTPLSAPADYLRACHPLLFLTQNGSFLCKSEKIIHFNRGDCVKLLQSYLQLVTPVSLDILKTLPEGKIMHATKTLGGPVHFYDVNDKTTTCVGIVSEPFLNILNNVFISTTAVFHQ